MRLEEKKQKHSIRIYTHGTAEKKKDYILSHTKKEEIDKWHEAFVIHAGTKKERLQGERYDEPAPLVFGVPLRELLEKEERIEIGVPILVEMCVLYLYENGTLHS